MKNLIRRIKNQFRYPRIGEIWALDEAGRNPYLFKVNRAVSWGYKGTIVLQSIIPNEKGEYLIWEGEVNEAGPIYRVNTNLRKTLDNYKW